MLCGAGNGAGVLQLLDPAAHTQEGGVVGGAPRSSTQIEEGGEERAARQPGAQHTTPVDMDVDLEDE
jgi:hypothetical protein